MTTRKETMLGIAIGLIVGLTGGVLWLRPAWVELMSMGRSIPAAPPLESNRVVHPDGYSIIKPADWRASISLDSILLATGVSRNSDFINVRSSQDSLEDYRLSAKNSTFQGEPVSRSVERNVSNEGYPYTRFNLAFERQDRVFRIIYTRWDNVKSDVISPEIFRYLETFHYRPRTHSTEPSTAD
jgi:hypothetical protein